MSQKFKRRKLIVDFAERKCNKNYYHESHVQWTKTKHGFN